MSLKQRIEAFSKTGLFINQFYSETKHNEAILHQGFETIIKQACLYNPWFTQNYVKESLMNIASMLNEENLNAFTKNSEVKNPKTVAVICAGNIPCVAFHDILCVLLSGHKILLKFSTDDSIILPFLLKLLVQYNPELDQKIRIANQRISEFDAIIATGSNNTAAHFENYFKKYPRIIRKNRSSLAVLNGSESKEELFHLGKDIFTYFGLGCRNVNKLLVPENYNFNAFFEAIVDYGDVISNNKYANNYEYQRAIYLLENMKFLDNNFLLVKESKELHSPVACLYYEYYQTKDDVTKYLKQHINETQCVISKDYIPFGYSQSPVITDFADGINTWDFLVSL
ncbi:MAG: acyl-CoA reductase [Sphingobacteriaceae bacterium]|nr:acyl-CoA reductase [Sphingobacteriaceae bacterium]